jgi:hypothetical protein
MKRLSLLIVISLLLIQCSHKEKQTDYVLIAENNYDGFYSQSLTLLHDSTFSFKLIDHSNVTATYEDCKGEYFIKNDTVYFSAKLQFVRADTAVIKDGFVEFINGAYPFKIKVIKTCIQPRQSVFVDKYSDYSSFVFNPDFYDFFAADSKPYDLNTNELTGLDSLLNACIKENPDQISKPVDSYNKICVAVITPQNEKEVRLYCVCKTTLKQVLYRNDKVRDGGDCYFRVIINLTKRKYYDLNVNGTA